jgi:hypothetical protein
MAETEFVATTKEIWNDFMQIQREVTAKLHDGNPIIELYILMYNFRMYWPHRHLEGVMVNDGLREWVKEMRRVMSLIHPQMVSVDSIWDR